jgi:hypothetical protein
VGGLLRTPSCTAGVVAGEVPAELPGALATGPIHQAAPDRVLLDLPSVARALISAAGPITFEAAAGAGAADVEWLVRGPAMHVAWLLQGVMALRGSGVVVGDRAVALIGPAASGKSAVAATLALRGHRVLADSALPVEVGERPWARGVAETLELWPPAIEYLGLDASAGRIVRPALEKRSHLFPAAAGATLAAIVALDRRSLDQGDPSVERMRGQPSFQLVGRATAMAPLLDPLGLRAVHFTWATRIVAEVPVFHLRADRQRRDLEAVADLVEGVRG